ncbi:hypothetical protein ABB37_04674 [Leptomonas pyrrhocoris]|uniref:Uncharacterized protein n=1 Tax=Leptomonas pyrrhocoris TaxID=157538 RepID=A0A0M9G1U2_LEPPY|nr:hypothetical protein ABB37_04674 [Leptomonas pyrrhocoris]KPA80446.1 hypothetical protein ABB37_04674 [Leptomonas pyrrhocoris]|eukprot:XP_015658885.1 hypothetical protein ABB37_04674 [Leptomonas pyrrhocoris]
MRSHMSTQALLDELAARERRVLEQLHELSGINQSPISPQQTYASVQATPRGAPASVHSAGAFSSPPPPWLPEDACEVDEANSCDVRLPEGSRGTVGNLEHDLQRLQYLLRHSPLREAERPVDWKHVNEAAVWTPVLQRNGGPLHDANTAKDAAAAHEKRLRGLPGDALSGSPVTPVVKRDRRETPAYAPPPPLTALPAYHNISSSSPGVNAAEVEQAMQLERAAPPRRSEVLDVTDEEDGTSPRRNATMFASRSGRDRGEAHGVQSYSTACWRNSLAHAGNAQTGDNVRWNRSPVRWFAPPEGNQKYQGHTEQANDIGRVLGTSALDAWDAHRSPERHAGGVEAAAEQPPFPPSENKLRTPPPIFASLSETAPAEETRLGAFSSASPPPRLPGTPSPLPKCAAARTAVTAAPTPSREGEMDFSTVANVAVPRVAETPQPTTKTRGVLREAAGESFADAPTRRAASALPRGVTHTTSWRGLRAFFARQFRVSALLTPDVLSVEDGSHRFV